MRAAREWGNRLLVSGGTGLDATPRARGDWNPAQPTNRHCLLLVAFCVLVWAASAGAASRTVVVLLYDGWAPALVDANATPTLDRMRREGAWTHHLRPPFPTISLISGVTISTGCWPEHHGIVTNIFRDPERGRYDHSREADWLIGCEHLHQVAERQGVRAAALGWYGASSETRGALATYVDGEKTFAEFPDDPGRADEVVRLLRLPDAERPRLILAYFRGPDNAEHFTGMDSEETRAAVERSDASVGRILDAIEELPFAKQVTFMVTTDHGMLPVTWVVNIKRILYNHGIEAEALSTGTTSFLYLADPSQAERAAKELSGYDEFEVIRRDEQPSYSHLGTGPRVGDLIVSARPPYFVEDIGNWPRWVRWLGDWGPEFLWAGFALKASHGYPPDTPGVQGIFYAWGAGIARGREVESLRAVDIHPTVTRLLGIEPGKPMDGEVAEAFLATGESDLN